MFLGQELHSGKPEGVQQRQKFDRPVVQSQKPKPMFLQKQRPNPNKLETPNQMVNKSQSVSLNQDFPKSK